MAAGLWVSARVRAQQPKVAGQRWHAIADSANPSQLADEEVFSITNRWRAQRGHPPVHAASPGVEGGTGGLGTGAGIAAEFLASQ